MASGFSEESLDKFMEMREAFYAFEADHKIYSERVIHDIETHNTELAYDKLPSKQKEYYDALFDEEVYKNACEMFD
jgi:hypothetical protein